jgi:hypothetical protein
MESRSSWSPTTLDRRSDRTSLWFPGSSRHRGRRVRRIVDIMTRGRRRTRPKAFSAATSLPNGILGSPLRRLLVSSIDLTRSTVEQGRTEAMAQ